MKNILLVSMLWISSWVEAQETATDTLQELPREETEISKTLQLERAHSTIKCNFSDYFLIE